jgi:hypothetical protein
VRYTSEEVVVEEGILRGRSSQVREGLSENEGGVVLS